jgi:hypothetical protein
MFPSIVSEHNQEKGLISEQRRSPCGETTLKEDNLLIAMLIGFLILFHATAT